MAPCTSFSRFIITEHDSTLRDDFFENLTSNWKSPAARDFWDWKLQPGVQCSVHDIYALNKDLYFTVSFYYYLCDGINRKKMMFSLSYLASFDNDLQSIEQCDFVLSKEMVRLNDYLIPEIDDMDEAAENLLTRVYAWREMPAKIDVYEFARILGLRVYTGRVVSWPQDIMGAVFFKDVDVFLSLDNGKFLDHVPGSSIVVDPRVFQERNIGSVNNTIIHECVHYVFHWRVFAFRHITSSSYDGSIICSTEANENDDNCTRQIERQATAIAPRILMRKEDFVSHTQDLIDEYNQTLIELNSTGQMKGIIDADIISRYVIPSLASDYGVSMMSIKIRMIETGFEIARGVDIYLDDKYLRPFSFAEGSLGERETFTLSRSAYERLLFESDDFKSCIATGLFKFVENHVVLCYKQFCEPSNNGDGLILTDFARSHLHLCALKFRVYRKGSSYTYWSNAMNVMLRLPSMTATTSMVFLSEGNDYVMSEINKNRQKWVKFYSNIGCSLWNEKLKKIMKEQGASAQLLAEKCNVSYDSMLRYLKDEEGHQMPKRIFTHICMILGIPSFISLKLINESGHLKFDSFNKQDACLLVLLQDYYGQDIEFCNDYLVKNGLEPFTDEFPEKKEKPKRLMEFQSAI